MDKRHASVSEASRKLTLSSSCLVSRLTKARTHQKPCASDIRLCCIPLTARITVARVLGSQRFSLDSLTRGSTIVFCRGFKKPSCGFGFRLRRWLALLGFCSVLTPACFWVVTSVEMRRFLRVVHISFLHSQKRRRPQAASRRQP